MAVSTGVVAIIRLEVAEVSVSIPVLKKITYNVSPRPPDRKNSGMWAFFLGPWIWLNFPIISKITDAREHLRKASPLGSKYCVAILVMGKAEAQMKTVANAKMAVFVEFFMLYTSCELYTIISK